MSVVTVVELNANVMNAQAAHFKYITHYTTEEHFPSILSCFTLVSITTSFFVLQENQFKPQWLHFSLDMTQLNIFVTSS